MQPRVAPPRATLTATAVEALIRDSAGLQVAAGCELLDRSLNVLDDLTDDLAGGSVSRAAYATLHGTAQLSIARELDWGQAIVRPYMVMTAGAVSARFNLGAYYTSTPKFSLAETPIVYAVTGYDILQGLADPIGDAYGVAAGTGYLDAVENILLSLGYTKYVIDQISAASVLPTGRAWPPLDANVTWLSIVNDLLAAIGYQGLWSDWDGQLRVQSYRTPRDRPSEWTYDAGPFTSMLGRDRNVEHDYYSAPNRWIATRSNNVDSTPPVEGNGIYTFVNDSNGPSSVTARGGRTVTRFLSIDAADQASLVAAAQVSIDADIHVPTTLTLTTFPNPLHWHFDRMLLDDDDGGLFADVLGTKWTLPLNGADMQHEWAVL